MRISESGRLKPEGHGHAAIAEAVRVLNAAQPRGVLSWIADEDTSRVRPEGGNGLDLIALPYGV
jgi:hypothetical protein